MDGVTILNTIEHVNKGWGINTIGAVFLTLAVICIVCVIIGIYQYNEVLCVVCIVLLLFFALIGIGICSEARVVGVYYEYEVTIDETVGMAEFMNTYEIVRQRGDIYVVKVK